MPARRPTSSRLTFSMLMLPLGQTGPLLAEALPAAQICAPIGTSPESMLWKRGIPVSAGVRPWISQMAGWGSAARLDKTTPLVGPASGGLCTCLRSPTLDMSLAITGRRAFSSVGVLLPVAAEVASPRCHMSSVEVQDLGWLAVRLHSCLTLLAARRQLPRALRLRSRAPPSALRRPAS